MFPLSAAHLGASRVSPFHAPRPLQGCTHARLQTWSPLATLPPLHLVLASTSGRPHSLCDDAWNITYARCYWCSSTSRHAPRLSKSCIAWCGEISHQRFPVTPSYQENKFRVSLQSCDRSRRRCKWMYVNIPMQETEMVLLLSLTIVRYI